MEEQKEKNIEPFGLASLVLGILSALIYFISILIPISALVLGIVVSQEPIYDSEVDEGTVVNVVIKEELKDTQ